MGQPLIRVTAMAADTNPYGALGVATVMSASDGADGAQFMQALQQLVEKPMGLVV